MDFKTFKEEVKENVRAHLPKEAKDVELSFGTYQKMNYSYEAVSYTHLTLPTNSRV